MLRLRVTIEGTVHTFPLAGDEVKLGRGSDNEIVLSDFSVSRRHAAIRREGEAWFVHDLGSTNGVQINKVAVKKAPLHPGDQVKVGIFELLVEGDAPSGARPVPSKEAPDPAGSEHQHAPSGSGAPTASISSATIVRPLADFSKDYGLEMKDAAVRNDKRKALEEAYGSKIFGFLTRLARMLITSDSVDNVLARVTEIAFEALPVDRGFILLRADEGSEAVCELARFKDRVEYRPQTEVPVSKTMLETVMQQRVALLTYDALADQRLAGGESIRIHQIRAAMCAPLWSGEKIIGVMQVDSPFHAGTFTEQDLDLLTALANYAAVAVERIRYAERAAQERQLRSRLERYHSPAVIDAVMREDPAMAEDGIGRLKHAETTVLFADVVGFTALSEKSPAEVAEVLEGFFNCSVDAIFREGGTLDKFIGDCVMAFFGAPIPQADHARRGVRAAIEIQNSLDDWNAQRAAQGKAGVRTRIALNSGPVVVGDVGSAKRVDYTVLGNTVNVAARLEQFATEPGEIVIGAETHRLLAGEIATEPLGEFQLKGLEQKITAHRVLR
ncbi:MAG: adenylate/guanylate cyclase domain-containing protein [Acidobacteriota bacterium]